MASLCNLLCNCMTAACPAANAGAPGLDGRPMAKGNNHHGEGGRGRSISGPHVGPLRGGLGHPDRRNACLRSARAQLQVPFLIEFFVELLTLLLFIFRFYKFHPFFDLILKNFAKKLKINISNIFCRVLSTKLKCPCSVFEWRG